MPQNEEVARQWMMEQEAIANKKQYILNKRRQGLASNLHPGLLSSNGPERDKQLSDRMRSLTGPMYLDGKQIRNEIQSGLGIRPNYPTPELKMHQGEVHPMRQPVQQIGLLDNAKQYVRGLVPDAVRDGLMNAQNWMRGKTEDQPKDFISFLKRAEGDSPYQHGFSIDPRADGKVQINYGYGVEADDEVLDIVASMVQNDTPQDQIKDVILRHGVEKRRKSAGLKFDANTSETQIPFNQQPESVQELLTELQFNTKGGIGGWPNLVEAAKDGDYNKVRQEMFLDESGPGAAQRNSFREQYFTVDKMAASQATQPMQMMNNRSITAPPEMYNPPDATMTLTKPFPIPEPEAAYQQPQPNLGFAQRSGGTYSDDEMQRMVALSQQLQNNYTA